MYALISSDIKEKELCTAPPYAAATLEKTQSSNDRFVEFIASVMYTAAP